LRTFCVRLFVLAALDLHKIKMRAKILITVCILLVPIIIFCIIGDANRYAATGTEISVLDCSGDGRLTFSVFYFIMCFMSISTAIYTLLKKSRYESKYQKILLSIIIITPLLFIPKAIHVYKEDQKSDIACQQ
jgi:hypothetical protein